MTENYSPAFYDNIRDGARRSAATLFPFVFEMTGARSIVDVGCGQGVWLAQAAELGIMDYFGTDGGYVDPSALVIPIDRFQSANLEQTFTLDRTFDLAMSLEVAEHLSSNAAPTFVDSLTRLAPIVLFSAAIPDQGGTHHINEQWPAYWNQLFEARGFRCCDCLRQRIWNSPDIMWWYAQNALLFVDEKSLSKYPALRPTGEPLALIHPGNYLSKTARLAGRRRKRGLRGLLSRMFGAPAAK